MSSTVKPAETWIGIDLGANFCRVGAIVDGVLRIFASENGCKEVMSVFSLKKDKHLIGRYALNTVPTSVILDACQDHHLNNAPAEELPISWSCPQDRNGCYSIGEEGGDQIHQQQVIAIILDNLKEMAEQNLGNFVKNVVISVPAYCTNNYRLVVYQAALIAGFENVQLLNQSTAAAITYKLNNFRQKKTRKVGIFCLGGNSVEVSVFCMSQNTATLVASNGSAEFGGNTFTDSLMQAVLPYAQKKLKNHKEINEKKFIKAVWVGCERAKMDLANFQKTDLTIDAFEEEIKFRFSREHLFKLCKKDFDKLVGIVAEIFGPHQHDIWEVMLVGGASKMAGVKELIRSYVHPTCVFVPAIVAEEAVVSGTIIKASIASCNPSFTYAYVDDFTYNSVLATFNGMDVCVLNGHEPVISNKCREACLFFAQVTNIPTNIRISQSSAGYVGHLLLNQPGSVEIQLNPLGIINVFWSCSDRVTYTEANRNVLSRQQVDDFKAKLTQYKIQEIQRQHQLQQQMEEERRHKAAEEERLKKQRLLEAKEKERQIREKQKMEETVEDQLEPTTLPVSEIVVVVPEQIPIPFTQLENAHSATPSQNLYPKLETQESMVVTEQAKSALEEPTNNVTNTFCSAQEVHNCLSDLVKMYNDVTEYSKLENLEIEGFKGMCERAHKSGCQSLGVGDQALPAGQQLGKFNYQLYMDVVQKKAALCALNEFLRRIDELQSVVTENAGYMAVIWDSAGVNSKYSSIKGEQLKALNDKRFPRESEWTKEELFAEFNKFACKMNAMIAHLKKYSSYKKLKRMVEEKLTPLMDETIL